MPFGTIPLNDGRSIPALAFGTGTALFKKDAQDQVEQALDSGIWHIDTAQVYGNEDSVGKAIKESGLSRNELYVTTKFDGKGDAFDALKTSLGKLGLDYVDLYLIHNPAWVDDIPGTWAELVRAQGAGLAKSIGVSNFDVQHLEPLRSAKVKPAVNQVEFHPYNLKHYAPLLAYAATHHLIIESYSSLTPITKRPGGPVDGPVQSAAERLGITPAQVLLLWIKAKGIVIVTTTSKKERLAEYLAVGDLPSLTPAEIIAIDAAGIKGSGLLAQTRSSLQTLTSSFTRSSLIYRITWIAIGAAGLVGVRSLLA